MNSVECHYLYGSPIDLKYNYGLGPCTQVSTGALAGSRDIDLVFDG